MSTKW